jgi:hypothetical protein
MRGTSLRGQDAADGLSTPYGGLAGCSADASYAINTRAVVSEQNSVDDFNDI